MDFYRALCAFVTGTLFPLSLLLMLLRVPQAPEWHSFRKAKYFTALACFVLSVAYGSSAYMGWTSGVPVLLVWFVVAGLQAILFTFTCVTFVAPQTQMRRVVLWSLIPIVVLTCLMAAAYAFSPRVGGALLSVSVACYLFQLVFYAHFFILAYRTNLRYLEEVYADDLASRLRWVGRLFFSALVIGLLAVAVILQANQTLDAAFGLVVAIYYAFVALSFVNYVSRAAFVVKAVGMTDERQAAEVPAAEGDSLDHVRQAVDRWVASKRYLESDVSVEEIAHQMGIGRQALNDYFATVLHQPLRSWRIELRIREALRLLQTNRSITTGELCTRCGYNDRSNFHKHFLKLTGKSVAEYRESMLA